jgi:hypothetical protein
MSWLVWNNYELKRGDHELAWLARGPIFVIAVYNSQEAGD